MNASRVTGFGTLVLILLVTVCRAVLAQAPGSCNPVHQLELYLAAKNTRPDLVVLAFDHQSRAWSGYRWTGAPPLVPLQQDAEFQIPFINKPRVFLPKEKMADLEVFVINTNPLMFSTKNNPATETNIEDLANLQRLAGLLGGFLSAGVASLTPEAEFPVPAADVQGLTTEAMEDLDASSRAWSAVTQPKKSDPLLSLYLAANDIINELNQQGNTLKQAMDGLETPRGSFENDLNRLKEAGAEIRTYLQLVENDTLAAVGPRRFDTPAPSHPLPTAASLDAATDLLAVRRNALDAVKPVCTKDLSSLRTAVRRYRIPLPKSTADQKAALDEFQSALDQLADPIACLSPKINAAIIVIRDYLRTKTPTTTGAVADDTIFRPLFLGLDGYLLLVDQRKSALKAAADLLGAAESSAKIAEGVNSFLDLRKPYLNSGPCTLRAGVVRVERDPRLAERLSWTKFGTESFQVFASSPFKDSILPRHASEVGTSFEIQRAWHWDFDVDVATVYTEIAEPVYSAVPVTSNSMDKLIRQTDEKGRAGELAMFLSLQWRSRQRPRSHFSVGPQLGVGLNTDHPELFAGLGFGLGRYIKLGVGWSWQEVKVLAKGQTVNGPVPESGAIRLRDGFDDGFYASLSITIDELPFFRAP
jgi:hypothetical protein